MVLIFLDGLAILWVMRRQLQRVLERKDYVPQVLITLTQLPSQSTLRLRTHPQRQAASLSRDVSAVQTVRSNHEGLSIEPPSSRKTGSRR